MASRTSALDLLQALRRSLRECGAPRVTDHDQVRSDPEGGSERFLLAGGAALLAQHLTVRPTQDLDLFTRQRGDVRVARDELEAEAARRGWTISRVQDNDEFCRLIVHGPEDLLVDLALESAPTQPPTASFIGPTFAPELSFRTSAG